MLHLMPKELIKPIDSSKRLINPLPNPDRPKTVVAPSEPRFGITKVNEAQVIDEIPELSGVDAIHKLPPIHLLVGPHNTVEVPDDKRW